MLFHEVLPLPSVDSISPSAGPMAGRSQVTILGKNLIPSDLCSRSVYCLFDGTKGAPGKIGSTSEIFCHTPAHESGTVGVGVQLCSLPVLETTLRFAYHPVPRILHISPSIGQSGRHPTMVTVYGEGFYDGEGLSCVVGSKLFFTAELISTTSIICNVADWHGSNTTFHVFIKSVWSNETCPALVCAIGDRRFDADSITSSLVRCTAPVVLESQLVVLRSLESNAIVHTFHYRPSTSVEISFNISPLNAVVKQTTAVSIVGNMFCKFPGAAKCRIGETSWLSLDRIEYSSSSKFQCNSMLRQELVGCAYSRSWSPLILINSTLAMCELSKYPHEEFFQFHVINSYGQASEICNFTVQSILNDICTIISTPSFTKERESKIALQVAHDDVLKEILHAMIGNLKVNVNTLNAETFIDVPSELPTGVHSVNIVLNHSLMIPCGNFSQKSNFVVLSINPTLLVTNAWTPVMMYGRHFQSPICVRIGTKVFTAKEFETTGIRVHSINSVVSVNPSDGYVTSGTVLYFNSQNMLINTCHFETVIVEAYLTAPNIFSCKIPNLTSIQSLSVGDGLKRIQINQNFRILPAIEIRNVFPTVGGGSTRFVTIKTGRRESFVDDPKLWCKWNSNATVIQILKNNDLACPTPTFKSKVENLEILLGNITISKNKVVIRFDRTPTINKIRQIKKSDKAEYNILLYGKQFENTPQLVCRAGRGTHSLARWMSSTLVVCMVQGTHCRSERCNITVE
eukprot:765853-Hanusia_phi.AAC.1